MATYPSFNEPLIHILNLSVTYGIFPSELKLAKVIPLYKVNGFMVFSNYRPVSVLPVFPEILEGNMYNQLLSFINKRKLLYSYQFFVCENRDTCFPSAKGCKITIPVL